MPKKRFALSLFWRTFILLRLLLSAGIFAWVQTFKALEFEPRSVQAAQQIASLVNLSRAALRYADSINRVALIKALFDQESIALTTGEFSMLKALVRHPRQPLSRDKLAQLARGREFEPFDRSLDVQVSRLRKLIEADPANPKIIQTVWGVGYVFVPDGAGAT